MKLPFMCLWTLLLPRMGMRCRRTVLALWPLTSGKTAEAARRPCCAPCSSRLWYVCVEAVWGNRRPHPRACGTGGTGSTAMGYWYHSYVKL